MSVNENINDMSGRVIILAPKNVQKLELDVQCKNIDWLEVYV